MAQINKKIIRSLDESQFFESLSRRPVTAHCASGFEASGPAASVWLSAELCLPAAVSLFLAAFSQMVRFCFSLSRAFSISV